MRSQLLLTTIFSLISASSALANTSCTETDYVFTSEANVEIKTQGMGYSPKCLRVLPGTVITIQASKRHPLQGIQNPTNDNPFVMDTDAEVAVTQRMPGVGEYSYFCTNHGDTQGNGMAGSIQVVTQ
ncbi:MAG: hypothetical protein M9962_00650 [Oligoflexia bacterium]|nr:hypothetical protein [Oligoflexia bacterium]